MHDLYFQAEINRVNVIGAAGKFMESIWHSREWCIKTNENVWKSYGREKNKMLKNWIKQQISRNSKIENNLKVVNITVKSWLVEVAYTFVSY